MRQLGGKALRLVLVLFVLSILSFASVRLIPGDPAKTIAFGSADFDGAVAEVRRDLGLDQPLVVQYGRWIDGLAHGDLGRYYRAAGSTPATDVAAALPVSLSLVLYTQLGALLLAVPLGVLAAYRAGTVADKAISAWTFLGLSVPTFVVAFLAKKYLAVDHQWLPESGWKPIGDGVVEHLRHAILPVTAMVFAQAAVYYRLLRSDMIATLQEDFITLAKSKGLRPRRVLFRHALRPSSLTLLTVSGLNIGTLISSTVVIEVIFGIQGLGFRLAKAIQSNEYVATQSFIVIIGAIFVLINFTVDLLYTVLDPRIRRG